MAIRSSMLATFAGPQARTAEVRLFRAGTAEAMHALTVAIDAARAAGALLLEFARGDLAISEKGTRGDLVTAADRASEALIVERLRAATPHATILGEESGSTTGTSDERWIVDPLDGTTNYAHGYPIYCVSIAYEVAGEMAAGVVYAPALGELYAAERGGGTTCNGARVTVSDLSRVADSLVCTGFKPANYDRNGEYFARLSRVAQGVRRDGAAALDLAFVAAGRFEAFWEYDLAPWDIAAGSLLVREAGGRVSAIDGSAFRIDGVSTLATNGRVHDEMIGELEVR
jgi:myo-inositol-1(or 4)-monophosphatase